MGRGSRRLYLQVYLAFVGIVVLFALLTAAMLFLFRDDPRHAPWAQGLAEAASEALPPPGAGRTATRTALRSLSERFGVAMLLLGPDGRPLARAGRMPPPPPVGELRPGWRRARGGVQLALPLADGRLLIAHQRGPVAARWPWALLALVIAIGIGAHPLARRITRRLERLQAGVEGLGAGRLSTRVPVEGRDEVAQLAASFNRAAERIERLVTSQRGMLANASHELRSPLARLRVAVELLADRADPALADDLRRDVAELDALVDEILLMSRIEASEGRTRDEALDLLALVAEEAAAAGVDVDGESAPMRGDPVWLRRLARNLFENARRHAGAAGVRCSVTATGADWLLVVEDDGPGIPETERERVFEPFYRRAGHAEGEGGGVGLGLALVRQIARRHGGDVRCTVGEGGGSRFEVRLARDGGAGDEGATAPAGR